MNGFLIRHRSCNPKMVIHKNKSQLYLQKKWCYFFNKDRYTYVASIHVFSWNELSTTIYRFVILPIHLEHLNCFEQVFMLSKACKTTRTSFLFSCFLNFQSFLVWSYLTVWDQYLSLLWDFLLSFILQSASEKTCYCMDLKIRWFWLFFFCSKWNSLDQINHRDAKKTTGLSVGGINFRKESFLWTWFWWNSLCCKK